MTRDEMLALAEAKPREILARARCMRRFDKPICERLCDECLYWADNDLADLARHGLAVVPVEPTEAMIWSGGASHDHPSVFMGGPSHAGRRRAERIYRAMLAAAQEPQR